MKNGNRPILGLKLSLNYEKSVENVYVGVVIFALWYERMHIQSTSGLERILLHEEWYFRF